MRQARIVPFTLIVACVLAMALTTNAQPQQACPGHASCWAKTSTFLKAVQTDARFEPAIDQDWNDDVDTKLDTITDISKDGVRHRPNILIIYVDDMGWGDPGVYGGGPALGAPTPNIDALAATGLRMTSAYSQPACTPTRAAWQTGRLPQRTGLTRPTAAGEESSGMGDELTIATLLSKKEYLTGMAGKWHLGEGANMWPTDVGYDEYYGNLGVNTAYHDWRDKNFSPELVFDSDRTNAMTTLDFVKTTVISSAAAIAAANEADESGKTLYAIDVYNPNDTGQEVIDLDTEPNLEMKYLEWSKDFMERALTGDGVAANAKPYFLYHAMNRVHTKNYPNSKYFEGQSPASTPFRDGIMEIDYVVGQLVAKARALDATHGTTTFIFFTSDNGAEEDVHAGGINTSDSGHQPWRGAKGTTWEGGVRVSAIAAMDGLIQEGRVSDGLFDHMDLFNTLARMGGYSEADLQARPELADRYIDGIDQTGWLLTDQDDWDPINEGSDLDAISDDTAIPPLADLVDPGQTSNREAIFYWYGQEFYGVRWAEFKRMERIMNIGMSVGPQTYGGLFNATKSETSDPSMGWYFNLYSDPKERMPITRTWNIGTLNELSTRSKMTFVNYPQAPHGVKLNGYILGGPAGGTIPAAALADVIALSQITHASMPD